MISVYYDRSAKIKIQPIGVSPINNNSQDCIPPLFRVFFIWAEVYEILTNNTYEIYAMSPYLTKIKSWLDKADRMKYNKVLQD